MPASFKLHTLISDDISGSRVKFLSESIKVAQRFTGVLTMAGVRQGCVLALIVLSCVAGKGKTLEVFVPHLIEAYSGRSITFDVIYSPYAASDDVTINITKQSQKFAVIEVANESMAEIQRFGTWSRRVTLVQKKEKFFVTLDNVAVVDDGDYDVTVKVNGVSKEKRMRIGVLEYPSDISIEIINGSPGSYPDKTPVQFMCSGVGGRPLGEITLARKTLGDVNYVPLGADLLNKTAAGREFNYTFQRLVDQQDNGSLYVCQIYRGPFFLKTGLLKQSSHVELSVEVTGASLTTSPSQITIGGSSPTSQLTVRCRPDAPGITQVFTIEIGKKSSTGSDQPIIRMTNTDSSVQVVDTSLQQRMTPSGFINGAEANLQFILTDLRCADAASTYYCKTLYLAGSAGSDEATTNITARTYPEQIEMFPSPDRVQYDDGQRISFRCTARIGNQFDENNLQNLWTWQWRSIDNSESSSWTRYPNDQNITYDSTASAGDCQYTGASTLVHTVSDRDNGRQFRCSVLSADYNANKTVYIVGQTGPGVTGSPGTTTGDAGVDGGMIAGIVVAILVVIVIIIVVIVVMRRRKNGGEHYETKEEDGRDERPEMTPNVVYSTPASYDQRPNRMKGRENDAMDEPHERNPHNYYSNRGQANPAMDDNLDDSRASRRSYDDDNTDTRMGRSQGYGSAV